MPQFNWRNALSAGMVALLFACQSENPDPVSSVGFENRDSGSENQPSDAANFRGKVRISLPALSPEVLRKASGAELALDTLGFFVVTITGDGMDAQRHTFAVPGGQSLVFEITGIPVGKDRHFLGQIFNASGQVRFEGETLAQVSADAWVEVPLHLSRPDAGVRLCVTLEGVDSPPCDSGSVPKDPPPPTDPSDTTWSDTGISCWRIDSEWKSGWLRLVPEMMSSQRSAFHTLDGVIYPVQSWSRQGEFLIVVLADPTNSAEKINLSGRKIDQEIVDGKIHTSSDPNASPFISKPGCPDVLPERDPTENPNNRVDLPPPSNSAENVICAEMLLREDQCFWEGYAKMSIVGGQITHGALHTNLPGLGFYTPLLGSYSETEIQFTGILKPESVADPVDTLSFRGILDGIMDNTRATGDFIRLPAESKGFWRLNFVECGSFSFTPLSDPQVCPSGG